MQNATLIEVLWTIGAFLGLSFQLTLLGMGWAEFSLVRDHARANPSEVENNRLNTLLAMQAVRNEAMFLLVQLLFFGMGVRYMFSPPLGGRLTLAGIIVGVAFFSVGLLITCNSILNRRDRYIVSHPDSSTWLERWVIRLADRFREWSAILGRGLARLKRGR